MILNTPYSSIMRTRNNNSMDTLFPLTMHTCYSLPIPKPLNTTLVGSLTKSVRTITSILITNSSNNYSKSMKLITTLLRVQAKTNLAPMTLLKIPITAAVRSKYIFTHLGIFWPLFAILYYMFCCCLFKRRKQRDRSENQG